MKISIIGGGPAGLYFATALKKRIPSSSVTVVEKSRNTNGIGYIIEQTIAKELQCLDADIEHKLRTDTRETWDSVEVEAKGHVVGSNFPVSLGIRRRKLLSYLEQQATEQGVDINYGVSVSKGEVDQLRRSSDLLVSGDGLRSVVRETYRREIGAFTVDGRNSFAWLEGTRESDRMRVVITEAYGTAFIATTYPIDGVTEAVIVETPTGDLEKTDVVRINGQEQLNTLGNIFLTPFTQMKLRDQRARWAKTVLNGCNRLSFDNVALIGESGFSSHYHIGAGLLLAFRAARNLADLVADNPKTALDTYQRQTFPWAKKIHEASIPGMRWLEGIKDYCQELGPDELIYAFRMKGRL